MAIGHGTGGAPQHPHPPRENPYIEPPYQLVAIPRDLALRLYDYLAPSNVMLAVHISPAERLRREADRIEQQERDIQAFKNRIDNP